MSGFTFAAGNAAKLLSAPAYAFGAFATRLVPRRDDLWVFGSGAGLGEGSLALATLVAERDPDARIIWLAGDEAELRAARAAGLRALRKRSWRGFRATLRASVIAVTHGFGDVNRFAVRGALVVQHWHGIPLKRIHLDAPVTFASRVPLVGTLLEHLLRRLYRQAGRTISLMPAAGNIAAERLRSAFGLPAERVLVTGDPRDDVLCRGTAQQRRADARALLGPILPETAATARLLLHAPTWRDGDLDPTLPTESDWAAIDAWLERTDSVLVLRPHPHSVGDYAEGPRRSSRITLLDPAVQREVTPVLPAIDVLITDYSSIAFDYALTGGPILFLAPDVDRYAASRGLYQDYHDFSGATDVADWTSLLQRLERLVADPGYERMLRDHSERLARLNHAYRDGRNTERVYAAITTRLAARKADRG